MSRSHRVVAVAFGILVAGCAATAPTTSPRPSAASTSPASPAAVTSGSSNPSPAPASIDVGPLAIELPAGWHVRTSGPNPSGNWTPAWLSPDEVPSDCEPYGQGGQECRAWPISSRVPGGIVVAAREYLNPGSRPPRGGKATTVAGLEARRFSGPADEACGAIGGSRLTRVVIPRVPGTDGWLALDACIAAGAPPASVAAFDSIVHSATLAAAAPSASS
jgi:hypothetical protein